MAYSYSYPYPSSYSFAPQPDSFTTAYVQDTPQQDQSSYPVLGYQSPPAYLPLPPIPLNFFAPPPGPPPSSYIPQPIFASSYTSVDPRLLLLGSSPQTVSPPAPVLTPAPEAPASRTLNQPPPSPSPEDAAQLAQLYHGMDRTSAHALTRGVTFPRDAAGRHPCPVPGCDATFSKKHVAVRHLWQKQTLCRLCGRSYARGDTGARNRHEKTRACIEGRTSG